MTGLSQGNPLILKIQEYADSHKPLPGTLEFARLRRRNTLITVITLALFLFAAGFFIAETNYSIQLKTMNRWIKQSELMDESVAHTRLIVRYTKQLDLYRGRISHDTLDQKEFVYNRAILPRFQDLKTDRYTLAEKVAAPLINLFRLAAGKHPINTREDGDELISLYYGFFHERARNYALAIDYYQAMLADTLPAAMRGNVLLHSAYCYALLGQEAQARTIYTRLTNEYAGSPIGEAASTLIALMTELERERRALSATTTPPEVLAGKLILLMDYRKALQVISNAEASGQGQNSRLAYYKGICLEETGNKKDALANYLSAIRQDSGSPQARYANRRIYALASDRQDGSDLLEMSRKTGQAQNDHILMEIDASWQKMNEDGYETPRGPRDKSLAMDDLEVALHMTLQDLDLAVRPDYRHAQLTLQEVEMMTETYQGWKVTVTTVSNEVFSGVLITPEKASYLMLNTLVGPVGIRKDLVRAIKPLWKKKE